METNTHSNPSSAVPAMAEDKAKNSFDSRGHDAEQTTTNFLGTFVNDMQSTKWSFRSEWSSNYTASNLPGPGRNLGNLYSRAGRLLENSLGRLAYSAGIGKSVKAQKTLRMVEDWSVRTTPENERREICKALIDCARCVTTSMYFDLILKQA